jgi:cytochrome c biogenesis protein CcmG, thiol:disulfide interchange protein DsbE
LLVQEVAAKFAGRVTFVSENFGASKLAERFGVKGYPAVFVDDVLVASPREFGYFGEVEGAGRYAPWRNAANQAKFRDDLTRMVELILAGKKDVVSRENAGTSGAMPEIVALPKFSVTDLSGSPLTSDQLSGRVVMVDFWATWCVPCRSTLQWLGELQQKYGEKIAIVALAVESPEDQVRQVVRALDPRVHWAMADTPAGQAFGDITAVPTMFLFDSAGKTARVMYGAPPDLHQQIGKLLDALLR